MLMYICVRGLYANSIFLLYLLLRNIAWSSRSLTFMIILSLFSFFVSVIACSTISVNTTFHHVLLLTGSHMKVTLSFSLGSLASLSTFYLALYLIFFLIRVGSNESNFPHCRSSSNPGLRCGGKIFPQKCAYADIN